MTRLSSNVLQHGPNGGIDLFQNWLFVLGLALLLGIVITLYYIFLPNLNKVKVTERLEDVVKKEAANEIPMKLEPEGKPEEPRLESGRSADQNDDTASLQQTEIQIALRLLEPDERKVIDALIKAGGTLLQKEISWNTGFSRVKTHRVLARLIRRDVVTSEKYYNTNRITLSAWLQTQASEPTSKAAS